MMDIIHVERKGGLTVNMNTCVICGNWLPEGRQVCKRCELINPKELLFVIKRERKREIEKVRNDINFNPASDGDNVRYLY